ncbi:hypothetical protein DQD41_21685 [Salmonella enterica subsp. enterica]|nr:hypothetical protein [Salmonella enterica subsp. enterica serovar Kouka]
MTELRCLRQLEDENQRLKKLVADLNWTVRCCRRHCSKSSEAVSEAPGVHFLREAYRISSVGDAGC